MKVDFNDPRFKRQIEEQAKQFGRDPADVEAELREQINNLPTVFNPDPVTNFNTLSQLVEEALSSKKLQEAMPAIVEQNYPRRADWTKYDVLRHVIHRGIQVVEAEIASEHSQ